MGASGRPPGAAWGWVEDVEMLVGVVVLFVFVVMVGFDVVVVVGLVVVVVVAWLA